MERHFTSTVYIFHEEKILLLFHKKHNKWMAPGGHVEPNETPPETARREALEETGVEVEFITQENIWFHYPHAQSIERPYHVLLETLPAIGQMPAHQHIDFFYVARPKATHTPKEPHEVRWFTLQEVQQLIPHQEIFPDAQKTIEHLFNSQLVAHE